MIIIHHRSFIFFFLSFPLLLLLSHHQFTSATLLSSSSIDICTRTSAATSSYQEPSNCTKKIVMTLAVDGGTGSTESILAWRTATDSSDGGSIACERNKEARRRNRKISRKKVCPLGRSGIRVSRPEYIICQRAPCGHAVAYERCPGS